jgi:hypothetical protein
MKHYTLSFGASVDHKPEHPERTAKKSGTGMNFDVTYQVWPNRESMARSIRMQQRRAPHPSDWRAVVALTDGEGF